MKAQGLTKEVKDDDDVSPAYRDLVDSEHDTDVNDYKDYNGRGVSQRFTDPSDIDIEESLPRQKPPRKRSSWWWSTMAVRNRKTLGDEIFDDEGGEEDERNGLLLDSATGHARRDSRPEKNTPRGPRPNEKRRSICLNYCVFGGISGLSVLAVLLALNLVLTSIHLFLNPSPIDHILSQWGKPGTPSEYLAHYPTDFSRSILPIPIHSHNDYWRRVPLFSALHVGAVGVEADVWLLPAVSADTLYVGHNLASLSANRTFRSLYVDPLVDVLSSQNPRTDFFNGSDEDGSDLPHGIYDADPAQTVVLLVDLKTGGKETWPLVEAQLQPLRDRGWLSFVDAAGTVHKRPVTVVGTGNTPFDVLTANATYRDAFFDAPLDSMWEAEETEADVDDSSSSSSRSSIVAAADGYDSGDSGQGKSGTSAATSFDPSNSYYASVSFLSAVGPLWSGALTDKQLAIVRGQVRGAHRRGLKARYWDLPFWPIGVRDRVWGVLVEEGVDILNVDDLRGAKNRKWG